MRANARFCGATLLLATLLLSPTIGQVRPESPQRALVKQYCLTCHSDQAKTGGLTLEQLDIDHPEQQPEVWEKVVRKLRAGLMPPTGAPRPERAALETIRERVQRLRFFCKTTLRIARMICLLTPCPMYSGATTA